MQIFTEDLGIMPIVPDGKVNNKTAGDPVLAKLSVGETDENSGLRRL